MFTIVIGNAQENCVNGIDDDGNGLIDIFDPACFVCYEIGYMLIEEDFEFFNCCPNTIAQTGCIDGWESTSSSPDYFHTCDYLGAGAIPSVPQPIPSGEGAVGIGSWNESMGTCLPSILLAGESYDISFDVGFNTSNALQSNLNVEFTLFGSSDCSFLDPDIGDLCQNNDWYEITTFSISGVETDSWISYSSSFISNVSANTIAIGHSCQFIASQGGEQYHFLDNIKIGGKFGKFISQVPEISFFGNCLDGVFVEADITTGVTYQWFLDGIAIVGATSNPFQIDATQSGMYQVSVMDDVGCMLYSEPLFVDVEIDVLNVEATITEVSCDSDADGIIELSIDSPNLPYTIVWNDGSTGFINDNLTLGTYRVTITDDNGCFTIEEYSLVEPENVDAMLTGDCINGVFISIEEIPGAMYQWYRDGVLIPGAIDNPYEALSDFPGDYHVVARNGSVCIESNPLTIDIHLETLDISGDIMDLLCHGEPTGRVRIMVNDMNPPIIYDWDNGDDKDEIDGLSVGTYSVTVIDGKGCFGVKEFMVSGPPPFLNTLEVVQPDMGNPGRASVTSNGGITPYTYEWNNGFDQSTDNNLVAGSYSITVTDANECFEVFEFEIISNYVVIEMSANASCGGECDGGILLTIDGPNSDYSVVWSDTDITGFDPTQLCPGTYAYTVTDSDEYPFVGTITIEAPPEIIISATYQDTICAGEIDVDISLSVSGGTSPFSFLWNTGSTNDTLFSVGLGTYTVEVMDFLGCSVVDTFSIASLPLIELQFETIPTGCNGEEEGAINLTINNGVEPLSILWSNNSISEDLIDLGSSWYSVSVTDGNGCMVSDSVRIDDNSGIEVNATVNAVNCSGEENGAIALEISGGQMPYDILWSNGDKTATVDNLSQGLYGVTVTDDAGCSWSQNYEVLVNSDLNISGETQNNVCFEGADGSIALTINNANTSYSILWEDGPTVEDRNNLSVGSFSYTLIDSFGCEYLDSFIITEGEEITYQTVILEPGCNGAADGLINISAVTGAFPFSYEWSNGGSVNQINDLPADTYYLTITDVNDCIKLDTFILSENNDIEVSETIVNNLCFGENEGSIRLEVSGGSEPYTILWSNAETSPMIKNLSTGDYFVTIEDGNGCSSSHLYSVFEPDSLYLEAVLELPLCHDDLGSIEIEENGGVSPYTFLWSTGETTSVISISPGSSYSVTMTDANQCTITNTYIIDDITEIAIITTSIIDPSASNDDGAITISVSGGTPDYTITWENGQTGTIATNLSSGTYMATVTDANGCMQTITIELSNDPISVSGTSTDNLCFGDCEGQIDLVIAGGSQPYLITWSDGQIGVNASSLCNGTYQATILDGLGEERLSELFIINSPSTIIIDGLTYDISCIDMNDGSIAINSEGGEEPFDYNWSNTMVGDSIGNLSPGKYSVTVMDDNGCSESETYTIDDIPLIDIDAEIPPFDCDTPNETIILNGENIYNYPYFLNGISIVPNAQNEINDLDPGSYQLSYAINESCVIDIETIIIEERQTIDLGLSEIEFTVFEGDEVVISITPIEDEVLNGLIVSWSVLNPFECSILNENDQCTEAVIIALESEVIEVVVTDIEGCETILEANIIVEDRQTEVFIPNIFSPNNDGVNDEFTIKSNNEEIIIKSLQIFDRWGGRVYSQRNTDLQNILSWDGETNGKKVTPNVFIYMIEYLDDDGENKLLFGDLAVVY